MSDLDELRKEIQKILTEKTRCLTGVKIIKAVDDQALLSILKSGGILSAEEVLINNPDSLKAKYIVKLTEKHLAFKNVIYAGAIIASDTRNEQKVNNHYGRINLVLKDSVLKRPNTTFTYFDTGSYIKILREGEQIELFKGDLLTESELLEAESQNRFLEVQIKGKISLEEIEEIVFLDREPIAEERDIADKFNIPLYYKGAIVASNLPTEEPVTPQKPIRDTPQALPPPTVQSPLVEPQKLPDFVELPKVLPPISVSKPLEPNDPMPVGRIPNFKEFKNRNSVCEWLSNGKDIEIDFSLANCPNFLKACAKNGKAGIWHKNIRYTDF